MTIWDTEKRAVVATLLCPELQRVGGFTSIAVSGDGQIVVLAFRDKVRLLDRDHAGGAAGGWMAVARQRHGRVSNGPVQRFRADAGNDSRKAAPLVKPTADLFAAMANWQIGKKGDAAKALAPLEQQNLRELAPADQDDRGAAIVDWMIGQVIYREAEGLIRGIVVTLPGTPATRPATMPATQSSAGKGQ